MSQSERQLVWVCFPRYRWFEYENPGCTGRGDSHDRCGWYTLMPQEAEHG